MWQLLHAQSRAAGDQDDSFYWRVPVEDMYGYRFMAAIATFVKLGATRISVDNVFYKDRYYLHVEFGRGF